MVAPDDLTVGGPDSWRHQAGQQGHPGTVESISQEVTIRAMCRTGDQLPDAVPGGGTPATASALAATPVATCWVIAVHEMRGMGHGVATQGSVVGLFCHRGFR
jgi:hypothetical protein